jgi:hypothetical protein
MRAYKDLERCKRGITTLQMGTRNDLYRVYNKVLEQKAKKGYVFWAGMPPGDPEPVITRVERQCRSTGIPDVLSTVGKLLQNAERFDPFGNL